MQTLPLSDADIFARAIVPSGNKMPRESAEAILMWRFPQADHDEMRDLLQKNSDGEITPEEREILQRYRRVGQMINILQAQAKLALAGEAIEP